MEFQAVWQLYKYVFASRVEWGCWREVRKIYAQIVLVVSLDHDIVQGKKQPLVLSSCLEIADLILLIGKKNDIGGCQAAGGDHCFSKDNIWNTENLFSNKLDFLNWTTKNKCHTIKYKEQGYFQLPLNIIQGKWFTMAQVQVPRQYNLQGLSFQSYTSIWQWFPFLFYFV